MTFEEASRELRCSTRTISRRVAAGDLTSVNSGAGARLRRADVVAYASRKQV